MILFADSSALVKLYVDEPGSAQVVAHAAAASALAVCRVTWVEVMSALARRAREQPQAAAALAAARQRFKLDWGSLAVLEVTPALVELAGDYTQALALRACDSVQLATLVTLHKRMDEEVQFACFDDRLVKAAEVLGVGPGRT